MFADRTDVGKKLAFRLNTVVDENSVVLAIPRGGVVIGLQIAKHYGIPLDVIVSKKITPPENDEYGIGSVLYDGTTHLLDSSLEYFTHEEMQKEITQKKEEVKRRLELYRGNSNYDYLSGKNVILTDDGIATGSTVFAIADWLKTKKITRATLAVPIISSGMFEILSQKFKHVFAMVTPVTFASISEFYKNFNQTSDDEVISILETYRKHHSI
jgi:predicted phosphoribosyltransferase